MKEKIEDAVAKAVFDEKYQAKVVDLSKSKLNLLGDQLMPSIEQAIEEKLADVCVFLDLSQSGLNDSHVPGLVKILGNSKIFISHLKLEGNQLTSHSLRLLGRAISRNNNLLYIKLNPQTPSSSVLCSRLEKYVVNRKQAVDLANVIVLSNGEVEPKPKLLSLIELSELGKRTMQTQRWPAFREILAWL